MKSSIRDQLQNVSPSTVPQTPKCPFHVVCTVLVGGICGYPNARIPAPTNIDVVDGALGTFKRAHASLPPAPPLAKSLRGIPSRGEPLLEVAATPTERPRTDSDSRDPELV